jgi:transposase
MKLNNVDVKETIDRANSLLEQEQSLSPAFKMVFKLILTLMQLMLDRLTLNSRNSSKPPSTDPNKKKKNKDENDNASNRKPGGQQGRIGTQLQPVANPDEIKTIAIDLKTLPKADYTETGFEARQVIDFEISVHVTEYRAQILVDGRGRRYVAPFPAGVVRPIQYGSNTKVTSVYMSQQQLIPYKRTANYFAEQVGFNISVGTLFNFNKEAYQLLEPFEQIAKNKLIASAMINADETGININGKTNWLHTACNEKWTHFYPHKKRGTEAMDEIGILPNFQGVLCHDGWKSYYKYGCDHALCNAHHLRELEWCATEGGQQWAQKIKDFLLKLNTTVDAANGQLDEEHGKQYLTQYQVLLNEAELECPQARSEENGRKRGKVKQSKARNLLQRLIDYHADVLRFMRDVDVPFTNNQGERDLRMTKVQQKISGCFKSEEGAKIFCRVRGYLSTCSKHGVDATQALKILFSGKLPDFVNAADG